MQRCEDDKVKSYGEKVIFVERLDTSVVWRTKTHSFGSSGDYDHGRMAIALENGKRLSIKYHSQDILKDWMFIENGDTIVHDGDRIISIKFHKE
ncbi:MAG: hypothetical protein J6W96_01735 [Alphaproteobacteria bacterium]|nr:hypothetical protein [Alphaproteobacteria bacterium]